MPFRTFKSCAIALLAAASFAQAKTFLLEAGALEMRGGWQLETDVRGKGAKNFLIVAGDTAQAPAAGAVEIPHAGKWRVWVRSKDFAEDRPGIRSYSLRLGGLLLDQKFGTHGLPGDDGWAWEDGGVRELPGGPLLIVIGEKSRPSARCESLVFSDNLSYVPEGVSWKLAKEKAVLVPLQAPAGAKRISVPPPLEAVADKPVASLSSGDLRVTFHEAKMAGGGSAIGVKVASGGKFLSDDAGAASWSVIARGPASLPDMTLGKIYPKWDSSQTPVVEVGAGMAKVKTRATSRSSAPWDSGQCFPLRPVAVKQIDAQTIELTFPPTPWGELRSRWSVDTGRPDVKIHTVFQPSKPGWFSLGFHGPLAVPPADADSWLLPFQFQTGRFPEDPLLILSSATPTPISLVNRNGLSCAVIADPQLLPFEWQRGDTARFGFGLRNEAGNAQPMVYSPVLGLPGSKSEGPPVETKYRLWVQPGDWYATYRRVADEIFQLKDYRRPTSVSLTDAAYNLIDLIRDEKASGWDAKAKAPVQIESRNVVSQCSPLTYMSLYLLTGDEDFYQRFARPSLEFLISRPLPHFAIEKEIGDNYYQHQPMRGPVKSFGASTYASAFAMTHGRSRIFAEESFEAGKPRRTASGHNQLFDDLLMLYRVTGEKRWLDEAVAEGDRYLAKLAAKMAPRDPGDEQFVNVGYVPDWEGLLYLSEATGEKRFRDAAIDGSHGLLAMLWTQPMISAGNVTLNPGGIYNAARGIWWWGDVKKRLGIYEGPAQAGPIKTEAPKIPERVVPGWTVSNIGLGMEQPFTYSRHEGQANIMMNNWAPNLLRLAQLSGDDSYRTAARNAMIGRFGNYPGYYLDGWTDEFRRPDYPETGPDISSLYWHHVPAFAAAVVDFLFTDAEMRSGGKIVFPALRQNGYVWFDNRLFGHAPGKVYGEAAWPWLNRAVAKLDNPAVDHVLAQGDGKFHVVMMNQTPDAQMVHVSFDEKILGRTVEGAVLKLQSDNQPAGSITVKNGMAEVKLTPRGIAVLTMDGVKIDVPTQRISPPDKIALPASLTAMPLKIDGTPWQAIGSMIEVPPFRWRDFYAYTDAGLEDLKSASLVYKLGGGPEKRIQAARFPFEFSLRLDEPAKALEWRIEVVLPDGSVRKSAQGVIGNY